MKKDIMSILNGDKEKYKLIMQKNGKAETVKIRWDVFKKLIDKGYTQFSVSEFFGVHPTTVSHAINNSTPYPKKTTFSEISAALIRKLKKCTNDDKKALFVELNNIGYSQGVIADYFKISKAKVSKDISNYIAKREFEERRKKFVKFR